jgi:hypothetical protein
MATRCLWAGDRRGALLTAGSPAARVMVRLASVMASFRESIDDTQDHANQYIGTNEKEMQTVLALQQEHAACFVLHIPPSLLSSMVQ